MRLWRKPKKLRPLTSQFFWKSLSLPPPNLFQLKIPSGLASLLGTNQVQSPREKKVTTYGGGVER